MLRDLASGEVQVSWFNITNPVGMMKAGRVRALAVAAPRRLSAYPEVPTMAEVGFPSVRAAQWVAAFAPLAVPAEIVETLHHAFVSAAGAPQMQDAFQKGGMAAPAQASVGDAKAWLREEMAGWKRDIEELDIVVDE
jgi:tripartite-type tricarboxylate transporter receptor subunit TctC